MLSTKQISLRWGYPLQVWKWPAVVLVGYGTASRSGPYGSLAEFQGAVLGSILAAGFVFVIASWAWGRREEGSRLSWKGWAFATNLAGLVGAGIGLGGFVLGFVILSSTVYGANVALSSRRRGLDQVQRADQG